jgi:glycine/D-amino acid oxidase-like deaminating enzyme
MAAHDESDDLANEDPAALLAKIREKAEKLLNQLIAEQAEIERNSPNISAEAMTEGRAAMAQAIAAARRTIEALASAAEHAGSSIEESDDEPGDEPDKETGESHRWN